MNQREGKTKRQGSQSGATLIPVIFIIVILAFIGVMFVSLINTGSLTSVNDLQAARALYVAEGGNEYVLVNRVFPNYSTGGATINLGEGSFSVATPAYLTAALTAVATTVTGKLNDGIPRFWPHHYRRRADKLHRDYGHDLHRLHPRSGRNHGGSARIRKCRLPRYHGHRCCYRGRHDHHGGFHHGISGSGRGQDRQRIHLLCE